MHMRFVFLTPGYHPDLPGGAYRYAREVAERLAARGHEVVVVYPNPGINLPAHEMRQGVCLERFPSPAGWWAANWWRKNRSAIGETSRWSTTSSTPTLLVCHHPFFGRCLLRHRGPRVLLLHGPWHLEYRFSCQTARRGLLQRALQTNISLVMRRIERTTLRGVDRLLVVSDYVRSQLPAWFGRGLPNAQVIGAGVNSQAFRPCADRAAVRGQAGLNANTFLFLTVRRLDPRMGLLALIDGFGTVAQQHPKARLWLAGDGPQRQALQDRIQQAGLSNSVRLLGFVPETDLPALYSAADATLMPSLDLEGFGLATVESLACGTPVLGSRTGGTAEILSPLSEECLFAPGSSEALRHCLSGVLTGTFELPSRARCAEYAARRFTWDRPVEAMEAAGSELVLGRNPR